MMIYKYILSIKQERNIGITRGIDIKRAISSDQQKKNYVFILQLSNWYNYNIPYEKHYICVS